MTVKTHFKITISQIAHLNRADYNDNLFDSFMPFPFKLHVHAIAWWVLHTSAFVSIFLWLQQKKGWN